MNAHRMKALLLVLTCAACAAQSLAPRPEGFELRVLTYNVNFGIPGDPATLSAIGEAEADLVALQETNPRWESAIRRTYQAQYPYMAFDYAGGASGLALLSKYPFTHEIIANPGRWFPAMHAVVDAPGGPIQVLNLHLRPPVSDGGSWLLGYFTTGAHRRDEATTFGGHLDPAVPALILGDFNERSGKALRHFKSLGARNAVTELAGSTPTWRWPLGPFTLRAQLDHMLYTESFAPLDLEVRTAGGSDHLPIVATFVHGDVHEGVKGAWTSPCARSGP